LREWLESWRDIDRGFKAAETRPPAQTHRTAIHEAGHAALQIALGLGCRLVSIVPYPRKGLLVVHYQPEIRALARALEEKHVLGGRYARKVFMKSLAKRSGGLMTF
jgi:ATP-dependent Zn protease